MGVRYVVAYARCDDTRTVCTDRWRINRRRSRCNAVHRPKRWRRLGCAWIAASAQPRSGCRRWLPFSDSRERHAGTRKWQSAGDVCAAVRDRSGPPPPPPPPCAFEHGGHGPGVIGWVRRCAVSRGDFAAFRPPPCSSSSLTSWRRPRNDYLGNLLKRPHRNRFLFHGGLVAVEPCPARANLCDDVGSRILRSAVFIFFRALRA